MRDSDVTAGRKAVSGTDRKTLRRALRTLHRLEIMAVNIYKHQIPCRDENLNRRLISAMANEMSHVQDFQILLYEFRFKPSLLRSAFWIIGLFLGMGSRLAGREAVLKTGVWTESKAIRHYTELIGSIRWDPKSLEVLRRDLRDEEAHLSLWKKEMA
ncbi:demethoxyubiquinone hydroxylase family protein [bacterium]|nr:demethoxyubiquinone hydroxylase family protein [bacterium]